MRRSSQSARSGSASGPPRTAGGRTMAWSPRCSAASSTWTASPAVGRGVAALARKVVPVDDGAVEEVWDSVFGFALVLHAPTSRANAPKTSATCERGEGDGSWRGHRGRTVTMPNGRGRARRPSFGPTADRSRRSTGCPGPRPLWLPSCSSSPVRRVRARPSARQLHCQPLRPGRGLGRTRAGLLRAGRGRDPGVRGAAHGRREPPVRPRSAPRDRGPSRSPSTADRLPCVSCDQSLDSRRARAGSRRCGWLRSTRRRSRRGEDGDRIGSQFADRNEPDRIGWREIVIVARGDTQDRASNAPNRDVSDELRQYPGDLIQAPLDLRSATRDVRARRRSGRALPVPRSAPPPSRSGGAFANLITRQRLNPLALLGILALAFISAPATRCFPATARP